MWVFSMVGGYCLRGVIDRHKALEPEKIAKVKPGDIYKLGWLEGYTACIERIKEDENQVRLPKELRADQLQIDFLIDSFKMVDNIRKLEQ
jgi:hypothetical protein